MGEINVNMVEPGMILGSDLLDQRGRLLLPKGIELSDKHLHSLSRWGVVRIDIAGSRKEEDSLEVSEELFDLATSLLVPFYDGADLADPVCAEIFRLGVNDLARKMAGGWTPPANRDIPPANDGQLKDIFLKGEGGIEELVNSEVKLSSFPDIYFKINKALHSPLSSARDLADIVSKDPSLSAKLLKLVNSPFYGYPAKIDSISRAITVVGANELTTLALGISAITAFRKIPAQLVDMKEFWKHSVACGVFAKVIASHRMKRGTEKYFVAGLLHDIGRLVMYKMLPYASLETLIYSRSNEIPMVEAEQEVLGFDHAHVGSLLCEKWNLPPSLAEVIRFHHTPFAASDAYESAVVYMADYLTVGMQIAFSGSVMVPIFKERVWEIIGLELDELENLVNTATRDITGIIEIFLGDV